jgi:hypothetical protein
VTDTQRQQAEVQAAQVSPVQKFGGPQIARLRQLVDSPDNAQRFKVGQVPLLVLYCT